MKTSTLLPAIRSRVGDWTFYVTSISLENIGKLITETDEIHERNKLSDWIQKTAIEPHSEVIAKYITTTPQRFLGALIIGVYDGNPNWAPLNVKISANSLDISDAQQADIEGKLGLLHLSGQEKLFAIDGQHRVAGIKKALQDEHIENSIRHDEVSAIFVAHDESSEEGKQRTRRLFTTVNKKAKRISKAATIALDEDNGFAIVTRNLIDTHWLFEDSRKHILYSSTGSIAASDKSALTSVVGLFELVSDLYPYPAKERKAFEETRPTDEQLSCHLETCISFFDLLLRHCKEYKHVFVDRIESANEYRSPGSDHLLFRPIGQRAFARAVQLLMQSGVNQEQAVLTLLRSNLATNSDDWYNILWNPIDNTMITSKLILAETQLLILSGSDARTKRNLDNLNKLIASRNSKT